MMKQNFYLHKQFLYRHRLWLLGICGLLLLSVYPNRVKAQNYNQNYKKGDTEFTVWNDVSDWYVRFDYKVTGNTSDWEGWEVRTGAGYLLIEGASGRKDLEVSNGKIIVGPRTKYIGGAIRYLPNSPLYLTQNHRILNLKGEFSGSTNDDLYDNVSFRTLPLKAPKNVTVKKRETFSITVEWEKGTDVPDSYSKYKIQLNGKVIDTVGGDIREYTLKGLQPERGYTIGIATYAPYNQTRNGSQGGYSSFNFLPWVDQTSPFKFVHARTVGLNMASSDGEFNSRVSITWDKTKNVALTDYRVSRSKLPPHQNQYEELTILSRQATAYNDYDGIPGYVYDYKVEGLDNSGTPLITMHDPGYSKPAGSIQGKIHTRSRIGEQGVRVCAQPKNPISPAGAPQLRRPDPDSGFCVSSSITGRYEIRNLYFFDSATYVVTPYYKDHIFDPMDEEIILDLNTQSITNLNFIDTSAIGIGGKVFFPLAASFQGKGTDTIPVKDAEVWVNGEDKGIRTDANGFWEYAILDTGNYTFKVRFKDHLILPEPPRTNQNSSPPSYNPLASDSITVLIEDDKNDINFIDLQTDSIDIRTQTACGGALAGGDSIQVLVEHKRGKSFFEKTVKTDPQGLASLVLPASEFKVDFDRNQPLSLDPNRKAQLDSLDFSFDLSERDTSAFRRIDTLQSIIPADTITQPNSQGGLDTVITPPRIEYVFDTISGVRTPQPLAHFIYYSPFEIKLDWRAAGAGIKLDCSPTMPQAGDSVIIFNSTNYYPLRIEVYDSDGGCRLDTGKVQIFDFIGDKEGSPIDVPISEGIAFYPLIAGEPNTYLGGSHPYEKAFFINVSAGSRLNQPYIYWGLVQGTEELTPTFTSRSPKMPDLIVHDPPGDNSYAWIEKGSSYQIEESTFAEFEDDNGNAFFDLILGAYVETSIGIGAAVETELGSGVKISGNLIKGSSEENVLSNTFTYSFSESFSTSSDPNFTGNDGDVYIGKATNRRFSIARVLLYDTTTCAASVQNRPNLEETGIESVFMYAEKHIKGVLIPQLNYLETLFIRQSSRTTDPDEKTRLQAEADSFKADVMNWEGVLYKNALHRDSLAIDSKKNISFGAGTIYERTETMDTTRSNSYEYVDYLEKSFALSYNFVLKGGGPWVETELGAGGTFRKETKVIKNTDTTSFFTVGYHLEDDDFGDYFSIDILEDTSHNVPSFRLWGGTSSCPHEPGTQPRDKAKIIVIPPRVDNVEPGKLAHFTATLSNKSESKEQREYHVKALTTTNPHGATIKLGGNTINNSPVSFVLDTLGYDIDMTVERGPRAYGYENIGIMMYPPCEYELWENNGAITSGDTAWITVNYQTECSPVNIFNPTNNWFVNDQSGPLLAVDFGGYERGNNYLRSITLEYKQEGSDWVDGPTVPKDSLKESLYRVIMDFTNLADGKYWLRGRADCSSNQGVLYSPEFVGMVDRYSTAPMGRPFPADGFLRNGQQIVVKWDQPIDTAFSNRSTYYAAPKISLRTLDIDEEIPFTIDWRADSLEMYLIPQIDIFNDLAYKGVELRARVEGVRSGIQPDQDFQVYPVSWDFQINTSPVTWAPDWVEDTIIQGTQGFMSSSLQNVTKLLKPYFIAYHPDWAIPSSFDGNVLPFNERQIEFAIDPGLAPGFYQDSVVVLVDLVPETLILNLEVVSKTPDWRIDPTDYEYSMKMIVAISLDSSDTNLSRDPRDRVGVFANGECRGFAQLEYVEAVDQYLAYLNVFSAPASGEVMYFRIWHAESGQYYEAKDSLVFYSNMSVGRITKPHIVHPEYGYQMIPLTKGWNWVSFNRENPDMSVEYLLKSLGSTQKGNAVAIKRKEGQTATFAQKHDAYRYDPDQWSGELTQLDAGMGYMINLSETADTLWMPGVPVQNAPAQEIYSGWNWIGYPEQSAQPINEALEDATFFGGDLFTSQYATAEYRDIDSTWIGNLQLLKPGEGYRLLLSEGKTYNPLQFSRNDSLALVVDHTQYESSMTLIAEITFAEKYDLEMGRLVVGGFINDECRGTGKVEWVNSLGAYRIIFSLAGNPMDVGQEITFKLFDTLNGVTKTAHNQESFNLERILGTMDQPLLLFEDIRLHEKDYFLEQNMPNPFSGQTTIEYILPKDEKVRIFVSDPSGRILQVLVDENQSEGEHFTSFDGTNLTPGIYFCTMQAGDFVANRKMVLID